MIRLVNYEMLHKSNEFKKIPHLAFIILNQERDLKKISCQACGQQILTPKFNPLRGGIVFCLFSPSNLICYDLLYFFDVG